MNDRELEMRGRYDLVDSYEYNLVRDQAHFNSKVADKYRAKYLELRKILREYQKQSGVVFPEHINKAIGTK